MFRLVALLGWVRSALQQLHLVSGSGTGIGLISGVTVSFAYCGWSVPGVRQRSSVALRGPSAFSVLKMKED